eukprot:13720258-Alexandrium_andersonii.AAC.1
MSWRSLATTMIGFGNCPGSSRARAQRQPVMDPLKNTKSRRPVTYGPSTAWMMPSSSLPRGRPSRSSYGSHHT